MQPPPSTPDPAADGGGDYECLVCDAPVLREGSECFDCRSRRPEALRENKAIAVDDRRGALARWTLAGGALAAAAIVAAVADLGGPEQLWTVPLSGAVALLHPVAGNCVLAANAAGVVWALDAATGEQRWKATLDSPVHALETRGGFAYAATEGGIDCRNLRTGVVQWQRADLGEDGVAFAFVRDRLLCSGGRQLQALEPETGATDWAYVLADEAHAGGVTGRGSSGWLAFSAAGGTRHGVLALDLRLRIERWRLPLDAAVVDGPWLAGPHVVVVTQDQRVLALDAIDGSIRWRCEGARGRGIESEGVLVLPRASDVLAVDVQTGAEVWRNATVPGCIGLALRDDGTVLATAAQQLHALRRGTGRARWTRDLGLSVAPGLAAAAGLAFIGTASGQVFAADVR